MSAGQVNFRDRPKPSCTPSQKSNVPDLKDRTKVRETSRRFEVWKDIHTLSGMIHIAGMISRGFLFYPKLFQKLF